MMLQRSILAVLLVATWCQSLTSASRLPTDALTGTGLSGATAPATAALTGVTEKLALKRDNGADMEGSSSDGTDTDGTGNDGTDADGGQGDDLGATDDLSAQSGKGIAMNSGRQNGGTLGSLESTVVNALKRRDTGAAGGNKVAEEQSAPGHTSVALLNLRRRDGGGGVDTATSKLEADQAVNEMLQATHGDAVTEMLGSSFDSTGMGGSSQSDLSRRKLKDDTGSNGDSDRQKTAPSGGHTDVSLVSLRRRDAGLVGGGGDLSSGFFGGGGEQASKQAGSTVSLVNLRRRSPDKVVDADEGSNAPPGDDGITIDVDEGLTGDSTDANVGGLKVRRLSRRRVSRFSRRSGNNNANQLPPQEKTSSGGSSVSLVNL
ncbi:hypothetical protein [Absidia glauca]|uniref:Uncharacterized protein n=1 Tax=Absidia glauca TaxID=4829 RepID=A0A163K6H7_ABSGL|nr:hypothetical protein [Absidia glauca]